MKPLLLVLGLGLSLGARAQSTPGVGSVAATTSPAAPAALMKKGQMMTPKDGQLVPMTGEMTLANGTIVRPNGMLQLPNGRQMPLSEGEQVSKNGMVMPAPHPAHRRVTRFNKHVSSGMMKPRPR